METKLPEIGKRIMSNLNWKLILGSTLSGTTVGSVYGYYSINYIHTSSGTYKISAPPPHPQLLSRKGQVEICKIYVKLFERAHNRHYISDTDYSPVLKKLCGINPGDILINIIFVQHDNAKPYIGANIQFEDAARRQGLDVKIVCQPPNSPDLNVLDLGYFRSIESLQQTEYMSNIDELVNAVIKSFEELSADSLKKIFVTLQLVTVEVLKAKGSNKYKIPHVNKDRMLASGTLPLQVSVGSEIIDAAVASIVEIQVDLDAENTA